MEGVEVTGLMVIVLNDEVLATQETMPQRTGAGIIKFSGKLLALLLL